MSYCFGSLGAGPVQANGHIFNIHFQPPKAVDVCDKDGSKLIIRDDDREEVIRERLQQYENQTRPVAEYYARRGRLVSVDGRLPVAEISEWVFREIERHNPHGSTGRSNMAIVCKSAGEIEKMRRSGRIVREVLNHMKAMVAPGVSTMDLERAAEEKIKELGAKPAFKGYYDYPCVLCTSVNEEIVHGIPSREAGAESGRHRFDRLRRSDGWLLR